MLKLIKFVSRTIVVICIVITTMPSVIGQSDTEATSPKLQGMITKGSAYDAKSQYSAAIAILTKAVDEFPNDARARYRRGLSYLHSARYQEAIADLSKAIELDGQYKDAYLIRGIAYQENNDFEKAIQDFDWVLKADPKFKEVLEKKAAVYEKQEKSDIGKSFKQEAARMQHRKQLAEGEPTQPDFSKYMPTLQSMIKAQWKPPSAMKSKLVSTEFKIHRDGTVSDIKLRKKGKDKSHDDAAINAIKAVGKFMPLPPGSEENVDIEFSFDYNVMTGPPMLVPFAVAYTYNSFDSREHDLFAKATQLLAEQKYSEAIAPFTEALAVYNKNAGKGNNATLRDLIQESLAACYLGVANKQLDDAKGRLKNLHLSLYYRSNNKETREVFDSTIRELGMDPESAKDHIKLGDDARSDGDVVGAVVEYIEALKIKDDPAVQKKLQEIKDSCGKSSTNKD